MSAGLEETSTETSTWLDSPLDGVFEPRPWLDRLEFLGEPIRELEPSAISESVEPTELVVETTVGGTERPTAPPPVPPKGRTPTGAMPPLKRVPTGQHAAVGPAGAPPPLRSGSRNTGATPPLSLLDAIVMAPLESAELVGPSGLIVKSVDMALAEPEGDELSGIMSDILATEEQEQTRRRVIGQTKVTREDWHKEIFEDAGDWMAFQPKSRKRAIARELHFVHNQIKLRTDHEVLDVGCGEGAHAIELAAGGCKTTGLDLSRSLLERGLEEAKRRGVAVRFVEADMREMNFERRFDVVLCLGSTFGYFDDAENLKVLRNMTKSLKVGGHLILDVVNRDWAINASPLRQWWEGEDRRVIEDTSFDFGSSRLNVQRSILRDGHPNWEQYISMRCYAVHELASLLHISGMRVVSVSGDLAHPGIVLGPVNRRLVVHAVRERVM